MDERDCSLRACNELLDGLPHQVRRTAEDQSKQLARQIEQQKAVTGESIGAMRLDQQWLMASDDL
jgi:hypothetical protein